MPVHRWRRESEPGRKVGAVVFVLRLAASFVLRSQNFSLRSRSILATECYVFAGCFFRQIAYLFRCALLSSALSESVLIPASILIFFSVALYGFVFLPHIGFGAVSQFWLLGPLT